MAKFCHDGIKKHSCNYGWFLVIIINIIDIVWNKKNLKMKIIFKNQSISLYLFIYLDIIENKVFIFISVNK